MNSASLPDPLADRLDQVLPPHSTVLPDHVEAEEPAVRVAVILARGPHPVLSSAAVARIQTRVLARAAVLHRASARWNARMLRWVAAACVALMILTFTTATASADSVPGDTLYPVKRLVEQGQLALSSNAGDVSLRLDFADRRLDEFETLLNRGQVNFASLNDALHDMDAALTLVENGDGPREQAAIRLVDLSTRQMHLAVTAASRVAPDQVKTDKLRQVVDGADRVQQHAHDLITPVSDPQAMLPSALTSRTSHRNLGPESVTFIPTDRQSDPATEVPQAAASAVPNDRLSKPGSPTPEPTVIPVTPAPTDDPSPTPEPTAVPVTPEPTDDPNPTPDDRPPAGYETPTPEPTAVPVTPEPTLVTPDPTDDPDPTPDDRPPADYETPTPELTTVPVTPAPTDDPGPTPKNRLPAGSDPDTLTPVPTAVPVTPAPTDDPGPTPENRPPAEFDPGVQPPVRDAAVVGPA